MGSEDEVTVNLSDLVKPLAFESFTKVLPLPFLTLDSAGSEALAATFSTKLQTLNAIQTQSFWSMLSVRQNALLCAPCGSGKSTLAQMLVT